MDKKSKPFHLDEYLDTDEDIAEYITEAMATGDVDTITRAIGVAAKARGMTEIAKQTGLSRESLYKSLSGGRHPQFDTIMRVVKALGLRMSASALKTNRPRARAPDRGKQL
jgi:probable addiction module antidote protein